MLPALPFPILHPEVSLVLSYRHGFHAGNHADVFKHAALCLILKKLTAKEAPFVYLDTHSGAGHYNLNKQWSQTTVEFMDGIERVLNAERTPPLLEEYVHLVKQAREAKPMAYPGSPNIARALLRPQDKLVLMELHNNEIRELKRHCAGDKRVSFHHRDGFEGLVGLMPPVLPRGVALIDPSYEVKADYETVARSISKAAARWATGMFVVWYPLLGESRDLSQLLLKKLKQSTEHSLLVAELAVKEQSAEFGMHGSGLAILNPPWQLNDQLRELLPALAEMLAQDDKASWRVEWLRQKS